MKLEAEQVLCRFQISSLLRHRDQPLYQWLVEQAHREGLQGATVLKGFMGLGAGGSLLAEKRWTLSQELPVIVEVVDAAPQVERLLARVEPELTQGIITLERAHVAIYRAGLEARARRPSPAQVIATKRASAAGEVKTMKPAQEGVLLRIFIGENDRGPGGERPLYQDIVMRAREAHLAGATVLRGPMGFGKHSRLHAAKLLELSTDLPIVIEIVDSEEKIQGFLPVVDELLREGLVTLEGVRILRYGAEPTPRVPTEVG